MSLKKKPETQAEYIELLLACNETMQDLNRRMSNAHNELLDGIQRIVLLIDDKRCVSKNDYEELLNQVRNSLGLTLRRTINYSKKHDEFII